MANIKSAEKRVKINEKKNLRNRMVKSQITTAVKKFNAAIDANDPAAAEKLLPETFAIIDSAAAKGVIHANAAARRKSTVASRLNDLKTGKIVIAAKVDNKTRIAEKRAAEAAQIAANKQAAAEARAKRAADKAEKEAAAKKAPVKKAPAKKAKADDDVKAKPKAKAAAKTEAAAEEKPKKAAAKPKEAKTEATAEAKPKKVTKPKAETTETATEAKPKKTTPKAKKEE